MIELMKKYNVFVGNYGSGKTELSLGAAVEAARSGLNTVLADMDIVNPYFRSSEHAAMLRGLGVRVIAPCFANTAVDVPSLPPDIYAPFDSGEAEFSVFDAGGDPVGAAALGLLTERFEENRADTAVFYVINACRPLQERPEEIADMLRQIEFKANLKVTALINNTNIATQTTAELLLEGQAVAEAVGRLTGLPVAFAAAREQLAPRAAGLIGVPIVPVRLYMRPEWLYIYDEK